MDDSRKRSDVFWEVNWGLDICAPLKRLNLESSVGEVGEDGEEEEHVLCVIVKEKREKKTKRKRCYRPPGNTRALARMGAILGTNREL